MNNLADEIEGIVFDPNKSKKKYAVAFTYFLAMTAIVYGIYFYFFLHVPFAAIGCFFGAAVGAIIVQFGIFNLPYFFIGNSIVSLYTFVLVNNLFWTGGYLSSAFWWLVSVPFVASFVIDKRSTKFWTLFIFILMSLIGRLGKDFWQQYNALSAEHWLNYYFVGALSLAVVMGFLSIVAELIKEKEARDKHSVEQKAFLSSKLSSLGEIAGGIGHEINNPLTVILGNTNRLKKKLKEYDIPEEEFKYLNKIDETVRRMTNIVGALKNISRDEDPRNLDSVMVKDIINDVLEISLENFYFHQIQFEMDRDNPLLERKIRGNRVQASQVLLNLLSNAVDAVKGMNEKIIKLEIKENQKVLHLMVNNNGEKIPQRISEKIFQPFFTTKPVGKGTGLGLSLSLGIMESFGGRLFLNESASSPEFVMEFKKSE